MTPQRHHSVTTVPPPVAPQWELLNLPLEHGHQVSSSKEPRYSVGNVLLSSSSVVVPPPEELLPLLLPPPCEGVSVGPGSVPPGVLLLLPDPDPPDPEPPVLEPDPLPDDPDSDPLLCDPFELEPEFELFVVPEVPPEVLPEVLLHSAVEELVAQSLDVSLPDVASVPS